MLLHLLKKDFLILKKSVGIMLLVSIVFPLFMMRKFPLEYAGTAAMMFVPIFVTVVLLQYLCAKEAQYGNASSLLAATPYPRSLLVISLYVFCAIVYFVCSLIVWLESLLMDSLGGFSFSLMAVVFLAIALLLGLYLPLVYKFGYEKMGIIFAVFIVLSPMLWSALLKPSPVDLSGLFAGVPAWALTGVALLTGVVAFAFSAWVSVGIYNRKDLA